MATPNRSHKTAVQRGKSRAFQVGPLVRMSQGHLLEGFRSLPNWARTEVISSLYGLYPASFERILRGPMPVSGKEVACKASSTPGTHGPGVRSVRRNLEATGDLESQSELTPSVESSEAIPVKGTVTLPSRRAPQPKGYNKPEVSQLDCAIAIRLAEPAERSSQAMRENQGRLSAALGAAGRGAMSKVQPQEIIDTLLQSKQSTRAFARLWPSLKSRKDWAATASKGYGSERAELQSVGDKFIIYTPIEPTWKSGADVLMAGEAKYYTNHALPLDNISFHRKVKMGLSPPPLTKKLIQGFLNEKKDDYSNLSSRVHVLENRVRLFWLNFELVEVRWGLEDENLVPVRSPLPKHKRRKLDESDVPAP